METTNERPCSRTWVWPLTIFFLALAVRLIVLFELEANDPSFYFPQVDSRWHHEWAQQIADGDIFPDTVFFRAPLYPLILGLLYSISGANILFAKIFWMIISALSCVLVYRVTARVLDSGAARTAGIIMAFYGTIIFFDSQFLFPVLIVFLNLAAVLFLLKYSDGENPVYLYLSALTFGFSAITRPNILAVVPFILLWFLIVAAKGKSRRYRLVHTVVFLMLLIVPILPTAIHNYKVSREFIPISSQGGVNLYIGNNPTADGLVVAMPEFPPEKWVAWNEFIKLTDSIAKHETGRQLKPGEISSYWASKALSWVKSDFGGFLKLTFKKLFVFFAGREVPNNWQIYYYKSFSTLLPFLILDIGIKLPFGLVMPLAFAGMVLTRSRWRQMLPIHLMIWIYVPTVVIFFVNGRYRLPVVPFAIVFAAAAMNRGWSEIRSGRTRSLVFPAVVAAFFLLLLNLNLFSIGRTNPYQYHFKLALAYERQGDSEHAVSEYREAIRYDPDSEDARVGLAALLVSGNEIARAERHYIEAIRANSDSPRANGGLANLYLTQGRLEEASVCIGRALVRGGEMSTVLSVAAELMMRLNKPDSAEVFYRKALDKATEKTNAATRMGHFFMTVGQADSAFKYFMLAVRYDPDDITAKFNLANMRLQFGDTASAVAEYKNILSANPDHLEANLNLAAVYYYQHRYDLARKHAETCLRIDPGYRPALNLRDALNRR
jgi:tetratricopeptide (TPR) repeat protein